MRIFARFFYFKRAICDDFVRFVAIVHGDFSHVCYIVTTSHCHNKGVVECASVVGECESKGQPAVRRGLVFLKLTLFYNNIY